MVPYAAGGPVDLVARALAPCIGEGLGGATVIVENTEGGGGAIGTAEVARAEPDGYQLALVPPQGSLSLLPISQDVGYTLDDFTPISDTYYAPTVLLVNKGSEFTTAEEFFEAAKANPDEVSVGNSGAGTVFDLELKYLAENYDVPVKSVPFNGGAEAQAALLGGNVDALYALADQGRVAAIEAGDLIPLATGAPEPSELLPGVPTLASLGYEDLVSGFASFALVGPAGMPEEITTKIADATTTCLQEDEKVRTTVGEVYIPEDIATGDALATALQETQSDLEILVN
jgi:tripartite-type tricarboxylate transporter receptor subunit TctC